MVKTLNRGNFVRGIVLAFSLIALPGCMAVMPQIQGSGVSKTESRSVPEFSEIDASHAVRLTVSIGTPTSVEVTTDDNLLPHVLTEVSGKRLKIRMDAGTTTKLGVNVKVVTPTLTELRGSGATDITATGVEANEFELKLNGASRCQLSSRTEKLQVDLSGASQATLSGTTARLKAEASGASHLKAAELQARVAKVDASGASNVDVEVTEELTAKANGASNVFYVGSPAVVRKHESGASHVGPK